MTIVRIKTDETSGKWLIYGGECLRFRPLDKNNTKQNKTEPSFVLLKLLRLSSHERSSSVFLFLLKLQNIRNAHKNILHQLLVFCHIFHIFFETLTFKIHIWNSCLCLFPSCAPEISALQLWYLSFPRFNLFTICYKFLLYICKMVKLFFILLKSFKVFPDVYYKVMVNIFVLVS